MTEDFFETCRYNLSIPIEEQAPKFVIVGNDLVKSAVNTLDYSNDLESVKKFIFADHALRAAMVNGLIGLAHAPQAIFRQAAEFSAHAYLLKFDPNFRGAFLDLIRSSKVRDIQRKWKSSYRHCLKIHDPTLYEIFEKNYEDWIFFGAHPSAPASESVINYISDEESDDGQINFGLIGNNFQRFLFYVGYGNCVSILMMTYKLIWKERYQLYRFEEKDREFSVLFREFVKTSNVPLKSTGN